MRILRDRRIFRNRRSVVEFLAIVGLVILAIPISAYILDHQRLRWPWEEVMTLEAEFRNAQAVSPGQGQNVTVAGVEVGQITKVETEDGLAVVTVELEPDEVGSVYRQRDDVPAAEDRAERHDDPARSRPARRGARGRRAPRRR